IEKTIYKASIDPEFREQLFEDRFGTIECHGLHLTDLERQMLEAIPDSRLDAIISQIRPAQHGKRKFMKAVATAVVTLAASTSAVVSGGCKPPAGGVVEDPPKVDAGQVVDASTAADAVDTATTDTGVQIKTDEHITRGVAPDEVEIKTEVPAPGGAVPDPPGEVQVVAPPHPTKGSLADMPGDVEVEIPPPTPKGGALPDMPDDSSPGEED
ncbi:MAG: hypothetical protein JRG91_12875, partial [Deltaproteobacteria bacterium]|nr:hypothetical protein [Deltaproteobacteria bacterium]